MKNAGLIPSIGYVSIEFIKKMYPRYMMREMVSYLKGLNKKGFVGIEIGVDEGLNAKNMFQMLDIKKLFLIDPYFKDDISVFHGYTEEPELRKRVAKNNLKRYLDRVDFIFDYSWNVSEYFDDGSIDFVYIDGDHSYLGCKKDIELFYPKVKPGGCIGGDNFSVKFNGVARAVLEFVSNEQLELSYRRDVFDDDWWVVKPKKVKEG